MKVEPRRSAAGRLQPRRSAPREGPLGGGGDLETGRCRLNRHGGLFKAGAVRWRAGGASSTDHGMRAHHGHCEDPRHRLTPKALSSILS